MGIPVMGPNLVATCDPSNAEVCIYCGQCVAVCPTGALSIVPGTTDAASAELTSYGIVPMELTAEDLPRAETCPLPSPDQVEALIAARRSVRAFQSRLVDHETLDHLVHDILTQAPSGHNVRGLQAVVVEGREKLEVLTDLTVDCFERLSSDPSQHSFDRKVFARIVEAWRTRRIDRVFRQAPEAIILSCEDSIPPRDPAILIALAYFQLAALARGLGTVWAGYFMIAANDPRVKEFLGIRPSQAIHGAVTFGYPLWDFPRRPVRPDISLRYR